MATSAHSERPWYRFDKSATGLVYGAITVLGILMAVKDPTSEPFETAAVLFGSVLAVTLAKAFAELLAHALDTGERMSRASWRDAWLHSSPTLAAANLPTLLFAAAGLGWLGGQSALSLSQGICIVLLMVIGFRVGWVIDKRTRSAVLGALFAASVGLALAGLKYVIH